MMNAPKSDEIKAARLSVGLTQADAAALVYCAVGTWQQWEYGYRTMHPAFWDLFQRRVAELSST